MNNRLIVLSFFCSILQFAGLVMVLFMKPLPVLWGIAGFAAIVKFCIPDAKGFGKTLEPFAAVAGLALIIWACLI